MSPNALIRIDYIQGPHNTKMKISIRNASTYWILILLCAYILLFISGISYVMDTDRETCAYPRDRVNILLLCYCRGGSSFFFNLMKAHPLTHSIFEPLKPLKNQIREPVSTLEDLYNCRMREEFQWNDTFFRHDLLHSSLKQWPYSKANTTFQTRICQSSFVNVIKTIEFRFKNLEELLKKPIDGCPLKVIHLLRDPRAIALSRNSTLDLRSTFNLQGQCNDMREDLSMHETLAKKYPEQLMIVRYEDLATKTKDVIQKVWDFVGLRSENIAKDYIDNFTKQGASSENNKVYGLKKDSHVVYKKWLDSIKDEDVDRIQNTCQYVMKKLGYRFLSRKDDKKFFTPHEAFPNLNFTNNVLTV